MVQFLFYSAFSKLEMLRLGEYRRVPMSYYAVLSVATVVSMGCANASLGYVNYPTMVTAIHTSRTVGVSLTCCHFSR